MPTPPQLVDALRLADVGALIEQIHPHVRMLNLSCCNGVVDVTLYAHDTTGYVADTTDPLRGVRIASDVPYGVDPFAAAYCIRHHARDAVLGALTVYVDHYTGPTNPGRQSLRNLLDRIESGDPA